jgi:hypothetical protein
MINMGVPKVAKYDKVREMPAGVVGTDQLEALAVTGAKIAADAVTNTKLGSAAVKAANIKMEVSAEQTGTGSSQDVAHSLAVAPAVVLAIPTLDGAAGAWSVSYGTHTNSVAKLTVTTGAKFVLLIIG